MLMSCPAILPVPKLPVDPQPCPDIIETAQLPSKYFSRIEVPLTPGWEGRVSPETLAKSVIFLRIESGAVPQL
jgi:hypothetical protein